MTENRSILVRGWLRFWRIVNGARIVFLNVLFLLFLYVFYVAMLRPDEPLSMRGDTTLVLRPHGNVVEQYSSSPLDRALARATDQAPVETRLRDILEAVDRASRDSRISQMVIDTDYLWNIGLSSLQDIEHAITAFKASGKPVYAVAEALGQHQYYLASMADEIWLSPDGLVWMDGYSNIRHFYREGLEKLEVEINLFRVGEYKSAMEPYIRNDMSPEAKEAAQFWLESLWQQYLEAVSRNRGMPMSRLTEAITNFADKVEAAEGDFAQLALNLGLVDRLVSGPEARTVLAATGAPNDVGDSFRAVGIEHYLEISGYSTARQRGNVRIVVAEGEITRGEQPPGRIGAETTAGDLRAAGRDEQVKAVVLRIDSPGGDAFSSEVIRREVQALRESGKTVVVSMGDVAASGGYWIAMGANEIWANPATITGSIGVYGMIPTFGATLQKIGVYADGVGTTPLAGKLRIDRPLDEDVKRIFQSSTNHIYEEFLDLVRVSRGFESREAVNEFARGRVWSGRQAVEFGLVDRTGTLQDAVESAARIAGLGDTYTVSWTEPELTQFERLLLEMTSGVLARIHSGKRGVSDLPTSFVQQMIEDLRFIASRDDGFTVAAHCLCSIH
ncbi:MAG: signal peptide peptidase SppA [Xanthomonadales bacterium]|nr:signal peptide peptidase SppA [Xanthomonadales bacterium]NNL94618.1 signal peptide peptidase SppA [Xanthomonadales bacterium]